MTNFKYKIKEMSTIASDSGFTSGGEGENHNGPSPRKSTYGAYTQAYGEEAETVAKLESKPAAKTPRKTTKKA